MASSVFIHSCLHFISRTHTRTHTRDAFVVISCEFPAATPCSSTTVDSLTRLLIDSTLVARRLLFDFVSCCFRSPALVCLSFLLCYLKCTFFSSLCLRGMSDRFLCSFLQRHEPRIPSNHCTSCKEKPSSNSFTIKHKIKTAHTGA